MNEIVINYQPFAGESIVTIYKDGNRTQTSVPSSFKALAEQIVDLTESTGIYEVRIAAGRELVNGIKFDIDRIGDMRYAENNKINVKGLFDE